MDRKNEGDLYVSMKSVPFPILHITFFAFEAC